MIHENIYSKRNSGMTECDPYLYDIEGKEMVNSFMMLFLKLNDETLDEAIIDFAETKRDYITEYIEFHMMDKYEYNREYCLKGVKEIFSRYSTNDKLDFIDIIIAIMNKGISAFKSQRYSPDYERNVTKIKSSKIWFIDLVNQTFNHNNLGYQVENGIITTKESDFLHQEVVVKSLTLLNNEDFSGALEEFKNAIQSYTKNDYEKSILEACKAYESTIKSILDKRNISYKKSDKVHELIKLLKDNGLFDPFLDNMYSSINSIMTSGINSIRNNKSGHGDGTNIQEVERSYASFAVNLAGSCIVFLIDRYYETEK